MSIGDFSKYVIYAHSVSRIPSRDNFVEHLVNGVGFHEVGRVGSEPSIRVKDVECFSKQQPNLLGTNKVEMIFEAINALGGNGEFQRAILGHSIVGDRDISIARSQIVHRFGGVPAYPVDLQR